MQHHPPQLLEPLPRLAALQLLSVTAQRLGEQPREVAVQVRQVTPAQVVGSVLRAECAQPGVDHVGQVEAFRFVVDIVPDFNQALGDTTSQDLVGVSLSRATLDMREGGREGGK